jgi:hypothetical protein
VFGALVTLIYWENGVIKSVHYGHISTDHIRLNVVSLDLGAEVALLQRPVPSTKSQEVFC